MYLIRVHENYYAISTVINKLILISNVMLVQCTWEPVVLVCMFRTRKETSKLIAVYSKLDHQYPYTFISRNRNYKRSRFQAHQQ